ncbi:MAG: type II toxin-antitoxin system VapC family toxin, partial [Chitinophagaceae bacterium]
LDTNICIYIINQKPPVILAKFQSIPLGEIGISIITLAELYYGAVKSASPDKNISALNRFVIPLEIFNFDHSAALEYGIIRSNLEKKGTPIGSLDMLIAAHAKSMDFIVVTNNEKEFSRVEGLRIENWIKE